MMPFTKEELEEIEEAGLTYAHIDEPPNREFREAWQKQDAQSQARINAAWFYYHRADPTFIKLEEQDERRVFWQAAIRCFNNTYKHRKFAICWHGLDEAQKRIVIFLAAVDFLKEAGKWRERRRVMTRINKLSFARASPELDPPFRPCPPHIFRDDEEAR